MARRDLIQALADIGVGAWFVVSDVFDREGRKMVESVCGADGGVGLASGHRCVCIRNLPHQADGADGTPESFHGCVCGALWTDDLQSSVGQVVQFKRFNTDQPVDPASSAPETEWGSLEVPPRPRLNYEWDGPDGGIGSVVDVTDVVFTQRHVAFYRDGVLIRAIHASEVLDLAPSSNQEHR